MKDSDWIKQLQTMMDGHQEAVPDSLWTQIEKDLPTAISPKPFLWNKRFAAAAAVAAMLIVGVGGIVWNRSSHEASQPAVVAHQHPAQSLAEPHLAQAHPTVSTTAARRETAAHYHSLAPNHQQASKPDVQQAIVSDTAAILPQAYSDIDSTASEQAPRQALASNDWPLHAMTESNKPLPHSSSKSHPITIGLFASNRMAIDTSGYGDMYADRTDRGNYEAPTNTPLPNFGSTITKHYAPYSLGVSVKYPITQRLALTTGLVYTRLKTSHTSPYKKRERVLHYVGIPFDVTYTMLQCRRLSLYAIAGAQADLNVKATMTQTDLPGHLKTDKDRVQFSLLAGPGLQLDISKNLGIYVEPTLRYYPDNGSNVYNYYKEEPWNFNLNTGVRLTIK